MKGFYVRLLICFIFTGLDTNAQNFDYSKQLNIAGKAQYEKSVEQDTNNKLVEIIPAKTGIKLDIRYATSNNFMGRPMYPQARAFTRLPVYTALLNIEAQLKKQGLGLKIFDGYRPYSITVKFFEMARDTNFVANPRYGSKHNRGCAVDLTLIDLKTGEELEMPTGYDSFTKAAAANYTDVTPAAAKNRKRLQDIMVANGFQILPSEWWHFDLTGWKNYALLDIPFNKL